MLSSPGWPCALPQKEHFGLCRTWPFPSRRRKIMSQKTSLAGFFLRARLERLDRGLDDVVDYAVGLPLFRGHEEVPLGVQLDLLEGLPGVGGDDLVEELAGAEDLAGVDLDVRG